MAKNNFNFVPGLHYRCIKSGSLNFKLGNIYPCIFFDKETCLLTPYGEKLRTKTIMSHFELASDLSQPLEELL